MRNASRCKEFFALSAHELAPIIRTEPAGVSRDGTELLQSFDYEDFGDGSKDRYSQGDVAEARKLVPEGVEGAVPYRGPLDDVVHQLVGGLRAGMGYVGAGDIAALRAYDRFVRLTSAGLGEFLKLS